MADWLSEHVFAPNLVMPLIDSQGRISTKSIALPQAVDPATLFEFTSTNSKPGIVWQHPSRELVTEIVGKYTHQSHAGGFPVFLFDLERMLDIIREHGIDLIREGEKELRRSHDRQAQFGVHEKIFNLDGIHTAGGIIPGPLGGASIFFGALKWVEFLKTEVFDRFGDGPILGTIGLLPGTSTPPEPGDFVKITRSAFPNPEIQARGGTRIVQLLAMRWVFQGSEWWIEYLWLDAGPNLQATSTPTLSLALNGTTPKHAIDVTISNTSGSAWQLQARKSAGQWHPVATGTGDGTTTIEPLAAGTTFEFRARTADPNRIRSAWSTTASLATTALTAPTNLAAGTPTGSTVDLTVTLGETDLPTEILLDASVCASASPERIATLEAGETKYTIEGMDASTTYCARARHRDPWGGVSGTAQVEFTTTATLPVLAAPAAITAR
jgi:hypothetical protein